VIDNPGTVAFMLGYIFFLIFLIIFLARRSNIKENFPPRWIYYAFIVLAIGDSFHMFSRSIVYFTGIANEIAENLAWQAFYAQPEVISLLGFGLAASSITIHLFYFLTYIYWRKSNAVRWNASPGNEKRKTPTYIFVLDIIAVMMTISHTILVFMPENQWGAPIEGLIIYRVFTNIPLYIMGIQTIIVLLMQNRVGGADSIPGFSPQERKMARNMAYWMIFSYAMYSLTVFFTWVDPLFGMAMLPKTLAYMAMFYVFVKGSFVKNQKRYEMSFEKAVTS